MISQKVKQIEEDLIRWRRYLHRNAELSFEEYKTTQFLIEELENCPGVELQRPTRTGLVVILRGEKAPSKCGLRR